MRLLITGGAGSLGSALIEYFAPRCEAVAVIDNFATGKRGALPPNVELSLVEGSIANRGTVESLFSSFSPTHVIHSAASYKDPGNWEEDSLTNVVGTTHVVKASERHGVKRLVNFQTALCYGRPKQVPIPITHPTAPFTSYGITKTAGEAFALASSLNVVSFRLANVTGPRLAIGPIPTFYKKLKAGEACSVSTTIRDFLDMSDFLSLMDIAVNEEAPQGIFNVSTGVGHRIDEVFRAVAHHLGLGDEEPAFVNQPGADDVEAVVLDPSVTRHQFGWQANVNFDETMTRILKWYDENGITDIHSHLQNRDK